LSVSSDVNSLMPNRASCWSDSTPFASAAIDVLPEPPDIGGPLWVTHLCWIVGTVVLYFPCRWFARVKATQS